MPERRSLLVVQHVPFEGPHRILDAFEDVPFTAAMPLAGDPLPAHEEVLGAVVMGGPMNVDEVEHHPGLLAEREWLAEAARWGTPVLGICLGAQLLACALGAEVRPGVGKEIGFAPVKVHDPGDPVLGRLAPGAEVLHWHGDVFDLPPGAARLASSALTPVQAFRAGSAWGVLFHPEADLALLDAWLSDPGMVAEAEEEIGPGATAALPARAAELEPGLVAATQPGFEAFAALVAGRG
jgi:GMP synthase (glutamine-hydrolysing)